MATRKNRKKPRLSSKFKAPKAPKAKFLLMFFGWMSVISKAFSLIDDYWQWIKDNFFDLF